MLNFPVDDEAFQELTNIVQKNLSLESGDFKKQVSKLSKKFDKLSFGQVMLLLRAIDVVIRKYIDKPPKK